MNVNLRTLDIACVAGLLALALGGGVIAAKSAGASAGRVERWNAAVRARLEELGEAQSVLAAFDRAVQSNQAALDALRERLPESRSMGDFLSSLDAVARRNEVDLSQVTPGSAVAGELCQRMPVQFKCRGAFASLYAVLHELETMPRLVRVDRVTISRSSLAGPCGMDVACSVYGR